MTVRDAEPDDYDDVVAFTKDTWADRREDGDYIPYVFEDWVGSDDESQRTLVADPEEDGLAGLCQVVLLSDHEAWVQGMRVNPAFRGRRVGVDLAHAAFDWARERGATVARNMVFSWNVMGLGHSRAVGFEPKAEFRWVHPAPDPTTEVTRSVESDPMAAWAFWQNSDARDDLGGLALDLDESWALAELTPQRLRDAPELIVVADDEGTAGFTYRVRTYDRPDEEGEMRTWAEYGAAAWRDDGACRDLLNAIARDAARAGADRTRVLIPESAEHVSDVAVNRVEIGDEPDFVTEADLTRAYRK